MDITCVCYYESSPPHLEKTLRTHSNTPLGLPRNITTQHLFILSLVKQILNVSGSEYTPSIGNVLVSMYNG